MLRTLRGATSTYHRCNTLLSSLQRRTTATTTIGVSTSGIETNTFEVVSKQPISSCQDSCSGQPTTTNDMKKKRQLQRNYYVYFLNQRGQLFHIFDVEGFINRRTTPSGPTFLRETRFLDFFFKRLSPNVYFMKNKEEEGGVHPCGPSVSSSSSSSSSDNGTTTTITSSTSVPQLPAREEKRYAAALQSLLLRQELEPSGLWEDFNNNLQAAKTRQSQQHTSKGTYDNIEKEIDNDETHPDDILIRTLRHKFPWVSHCGHEKNFLIAEDSPIVFHDLQWCSPSSSSSSSQQQQQRGENSHDVGNNSNSSSIAVTKEEAANMLLQSTTTHAQLLFAGGFREPFRPSALRCSRDGRLYHPVTVASHFMFHRAWDPAAAVNGVPAAAPNATSSHGGGGLLSRVKRVLFPGTAPSPTTASVSSTLLGLVGAQVGLRLGLDFVCEDQSANGNFEIEWLGAKHVIPFLDEAHQ